MSRLSAQLNSAYIAAASRLEGRRARPRAVAYVESYDDILFWRDVLTRAAPHVQFEVVLPSRITLGRGKKIALANRLGPHMIACVDADYDVLMQGATPTSAMVCRSPHVLHTGVYAIENLQCHAEVLHRVCVMATLNDRELFDFRAFLQAFSRTVHPLLVWNVWAYRYGAYTQFSLTDFARTVELREVQLHHPERMIEALRRRVNRQIATLQRRFPQARATYKPLRDELQQLGVTPDKTYLYMRGHDLVDVVLGPLLAVVCDALRREREREINQLACHAVQQQNELAAYRHAVAPFEEMLRKHTAYHNTPEFLRIEEAARQRFAGDWETRDATADDAVLDFADERPIGAPPTPCFAAEEPDAEGNAPARVSEPAAAAPEGPNSSRNACAATAATPTATELPTAACPKSPTAARPKPPTAAARLRNGVWTWGDDDDEVD